MADTTFSAGTTIASAWLNDANTAVYKAVSGTAGSINRTLISKLTEIISVKDFGAVGDGITDDTTAIQNAITATAGKILIWPTGQYLITKSLNVTERGSTPTIWLGNGFDADVTAGTTIIGRTAADGTLSPGWIASFTGSQNITISEMNFYGSGTNASTKGLLFARSAAHLYAQQIRLSKVCVKIGTAPATTSLGSIAIANNCAEQYVEEHCSYFADTPFLGTLNNDISLVCPYSLIDTSIKSATAITSRQTTFFAYTKSAISLYGVAGSSWRDAIFARDAANTTLPAIVLNTSVGASYQYPQRLIIEGQVEGFPGGVTFNSASMDCYAIRTKLFMVAASAATAFIVTSANVILRNCVFDNSQTQNITGQVALSLGATNTLYAGETYLYPGDSVTLNSASNYGHRLNYNGNGTGILNLTAGANITLLGSPNAPSSWIDSEGFVHMAGLLQATAIINAGITIATVSTAHRPNRTINGAIFMSGIGLAYFTLTSAGLLSLGTNTANGTQIDLSSISFKAIN